MTSPSAVELYYDPFDVDIDSNPYPVWKRMREEAPLYYNEKFNFYALSRYDDVARELHNWETYRSGRGTTADILFANIEVPPGILLFEDPPLHDLHRKLLSRVFTPRRMLAVEELVRGFCVRELDPLVGASGFDFIANLGAMMPMRTIGYLLGIPEEDQEKIRDRSVANIEMSKDRDPAKADADVFANAIGMFAEYIEWRASHPSDDLMTELLRAEIDEGDGKRPLSRTEVLSYTAMIAGAGNETTARLIGFMGQLLSDNPDARRELATDPSLIPGAIEETLRYEPPSPVQARYVAQDAELYGRAIPEGSYMLLLNASANRDERQFHDPDRYDIHRGGSHLSFGQGLHFCLGSALARLEARVAFEEVLKRWPDWEVDYAKAQRAHTASVRGWARLPVVVG
ncbi:cytochrome P450 [Mycobacterium stomatepiae]|uniref:Cytochrome P450 monooxygenase n=1 Tax=Mycobacterium stomatepiae TaxID=470076 RepID=A0A7I7Q121_9MYCO|nr:cytochrome P450 [Mycobacterium stomatepiae]MCV7166177.1 cytochrome P450 [Mycobacterium stomatepiae]BBY19831.1 cytochrome P450 monooxygenase [Mycobacterium stomatepiae]